MQPRVAASTNTSRQQVLCPSEPQMDTDNAHSMGDSARTPFPGHSAQNGKVGSLWGHEASSGTSMPTPRANVVWTPTSSPGAGARPKRPPLLPRVQAGPILSLLGYRTGSQKHAGRKHSASCLLVSPNEVALQSGETGRAPPRPQNLPGSARTDEEANLHVPASPISTNSLGNKCGATAPLWAAKPSVGAQTCHGRL